MPEQQDRREGDYVSREYAEWLAANARVEAILYSTKESFENHRKEDSEHFDRLYATDEEILRQIQDMPRKMTECSKELTKEIKKHVSETYLPITEFKVQAAQIRWGMIGGTAAASVIVYFINLIISGSKLAGG